MNYLKKYSFALSLLFFLACNENNCPAVETATNQKWDQIKTSERQFPSKGLWLHRTNQPAKFSEYANDYDGFEMDVNIDTLQMKLDVYHPPEKSQNIKVQDILQLKEATDKYFWFDCKNLSKANVSNVLLILKELDSIYHIKERMVFESTNSAALKVIAAEGYYCFYYLPISSETNLCTDTMLLKNIAAKIDSSFAAISADGRYIQALNSLFPNCKKATWSLNSVRNIFKNEQQEMLQDSMVLIVLNRER
jgi:hypothetical protein